MRVPSVLCASPYSPSPSHSISRVFRDEHYFFFSAGRGGATRGKIPNCSLFTAFPGERATLINIRSANYSQTIITPASAVPRAARFLPDGDDVGRECFPRLPGLLLLFKQCNGLFFRENRETLPRLTLLFYPSPPSSFLFFLLFLCRRISFPNVIRFYFNAPARLFSFYTVVKTERKSSLNRYVKYIYTYIHIRILPIGINCELCDVN